MPIEIERKFLVADAGWRAGVRGPGVAMRQGYLAAGGANQPSVRIRLAGGQAWLTVKGPGGKVRVEFEYPIPAEDAPGLLALSPFPELAKTRWEVPPCCRSGNPPTQGGTARCDRVASNSRVHA